MDRYTLIESYLTNVLSDEEKNAFELRMRKEPDLKRDVEAHAKMKWSLNTWVAHDVEAVIEKEKAGQSQAKPKIENPISQIRRRRYLMTAASLLLLLAAGWWWSQSQSRSALSHNNKLFAEYCHWPIENSTRADNEEDLSNEEASFYKAIELMKGQEYNKALSAFQSIERNAEKTLKDKIDWYTAMCYLKLEDELKLKSALENIVLQKNHSYQKLAQDLKTKL